MMADGSDYVDTGASLDDAARDLDPQDFLDLMAELGREMFGPPDPRPTAQEAGMAGRYGVYRENPGGPVRPSHSTALMNAHFLARGAMNHRRNEKITAEDYNNYDPAIPSGRTPYWTLLDAWQQYSDPSYPESDQTPHQRQIESDKSAEKAKSDAERKARMDALKARVRERMMRFKM